MSDGSTIEWLAWPGYRPASWNPTRGLPAVNAWGGGMTKSRLVSGGAARHAPGLSARHYASRARGRDA